MAACGTDIRPNFRMYRSVAVHQPQQQTPQLSNAQPQMQQRQPVQVVTPTWPSTLQAQQRSPSVAQPIQASQELHEAALQVPPLLLPRPMICGEMITVGRSQFVVGDVLGEGAYARVWSALTNSLEVAIKEMRCGQGPGILPDASVQRAMFEVECMQRLWEGFEPCSPEVLDHQFWPLGPSAPSGFLCRVAMTRRPGRSLACWLESRLSKPRVPCDTVARYCTSFMEAVHFGRGLVVQVAPTLGRLNASIAIHRDVNARNLLVHCPDESESAGLAPPLGRQLEFSVVDFGSSTCVRAWLSGGEGSWQSENPTGDARYWGPASWLRFLFGVDAIAADVSHTRQYSGRLDVYALAICALECVAKLHSAQCPEAAVSLTGPDAQLVHCIQRFRAAWDGYWNTANHYFERLAEYSRQACGGDQGAAQTWQELLASNVPQILRQRLAELCSELGRLSEASACMRGGSWAHVVDALQVFRDMATDGGADDWHDFVFHLGPKTLSNDGSSHHLHACTAHAENVEERRARRSMSGFEGWHSVTRQCSPTRPDQPQNALKRCGQVEDPGEAEHRTKVYEKDRVGAVGPPEDKQVLSPGRVSRETRDAKSVTRQCSPAQPETQSSMRPQTEHRGASPRIGSREVWDVEGREGGHSSSRPDFAQSVARHPQAEHRVASPSQGHREARGRRQSSRGAPQWRRSTSPSHRQRGVSPVSGQISRDHAERDTSTDVPLWINGVSEPPNVGAALALPLLRPSFTQAKGAPDSPSMARNARSIAAQDRRSVPRPDGARAVDDREHEALRILKEVEAEVRMLKQWYSEAIEAMSSPTDAKGG
mmetsp:Transcript_53351/g.142766  ORF Transcript_53351/g.142766 Transcript_53351/m.142766 type:complete len:824 (-) Transcript_53351:213-2684(-)